VKINLIRYEHNGDGTNYDRREMVWDTDKTQLSATAASRYGAHYEFVGIKPPEEGGLSVVLRFRDAASLDSFRQLIRDIYVQSDHSVTPTEDERVMKFLTLLTAVAAQSPHSYYGPVGEDVDAPDDPDWPDAEEGVSPNA